MADVSGTARRPPIAFIAMIGAVFVAGWLPFLTTRQFYLAGDSIASWLPVSRRIGELLAAGDSHLMDPTAWRGGNYVAEAGYGLWNPVVLLLDMTVLQLNDLELAGTIVKVVYLLILAVGVYLLAREYGADEWPSSLAGLAVPLGGFTLWMDAATWTPNLASFAFVPYVWLASRRLSRDASGPIWLLIAGGLCVSAGNPYSNVVVGAIVIGVGVEVWLRRDDELRARLLTLGLTLTAIAMLAVFVYLPFRQTSDLGFRETGVSNDEAFSPSLENLLGLSTPTMQPLVANFGSSVLRIPATYLAWFVLPLAPWLRWGRVIERWRSMFALVGFSAFFAVVAMGPSEFWFFRWPIRLVPYAFLPLVIVTAVALGNGLADDHPRRRILGSVAAIGLPAYIAWADVPERLRWHLAGALLVAVLVAATVALADRPSGRGPFMLAATVAVLVLQLQFLPSNSSVRDYQVPDAAAITEGIGRYEGTVLQITDLDRIPGPERGPAMYRDTSFGSISLIAGVESVSAYSGIGYTVHDDAVCLRFDGAVCAAGWDQLWSPVDGSASRLADLLRLDTVVVHRAVLDTADLPVPAGWEVTELNDAVVVWERLEDYAWEAGRLAEAVGPVEVSSNVEAEAHRETVAFARTGDGQIELTFARLTWPGYEAFIDGAPIPIRPGPAGLVTVSVPADVEGGTVELVWSPPLWRPSILVAVLGVLLAVATHVWWRRRLRPEVDDARNERVGDPEREEATA